MADDNKRRDREPLHASHLDPAQMTTVHAHPSHTQRDMPKMVVIFRNKGPAPRVFVDGAGNNVTVLPGQARELEVTEALFKHFNGAMRRGDSLLVERKKDQRRTPEEDGREAASFRGSNRPRSGSAAREPLNDDEDAERQRVLREAGDDDEGEGSGDDASSNDDDESIMSEDNEGEGDDTEAENEEGENDDDENKTSRRKRGKKRNRR